MNLLWSYVYARGIRLDNFLGDLPVNQLRFFADSGAHSARTLGIHLDTHTYATWVKQWQPWMTIYANLDVIGAPRATWNNQQQLEQDHGLHPMPVFHTGEDFSHLERYLQAGYTYIALGKLLGNPDKALIPWLTKVFHIAGGAAAFHGFGMTRLSLLKRFPFYSVDSSTWSAGVRYGKPRLFHQGRWHLIPLRDREAVSAKRHVLDAYNLPWAALSRGHYDRAALAGACAASMVRMQDWIRRYHDPIELRPGKGYPPIGHRATVQPPQTRQATRIYLAAAPAHLHREHAQGLHLYLADANLTRTRAAATALQHLEQDT